MEKKTIFLELPAELIEKIDKLNTVGDRSAFVCSLLEKQIQQESTGGVDASMEITTHMKRTEEQLRIPGEIDLLTSNGVSLGRFNINTIEGFEELAEKIQELSNDPVVKIRAKSWL